MKLPSGFLCDAFIDQHRYVGSDPVGYKCSNFARYQFVNYPIYVCGPCSDMIEMEPTRVTFGDGTSFYWMSGRRDQIMNEHQKTCKGE